MKILLSGPAGSGKTTQAEILSKELGINFINTGDLLREIAEKNTEEGRVINKALDSGQFADNKLVAKIVKDKLSEQKYSNGFITDGYPRNLDQLNYFDPGYDKVIYLDVPDLIVYERLLKRGREDDTPEVIEKRLKLYHQRTTEVLDYYQQLGKLVKVDARGSVTEVSQKVRKIIEGAL